ncbi:putative ribonuclease H1 [Xylariaceae sp. FL0255]|nr:putative ribonuclease H1 [Xylariaceae sp. FL0255]
MSESAPCRNQPSPNNVRIDERKDTYELTNGQVVCGLHGLSYCRICGIDYRNAHPPATRPPTASSTTPKSRGGAPERRKGTGRVFPAEFNPSSATVTPTELFSGTIPGKKRFRYVHREDPGKILIFAGEACLDNVHSKPLAGWALVTGPDSEISFALENKGPWGFPAAHTRNRAELRAVIAALRLSNWTRYGWDSIVIASESAYVVQGATIYARTWFNNGWKTAGGKYVENKDLWELLLGEVERWHDLGLLVQLWHISRQCNEGVDEIAREAAISRTITSTTFMEVTQNLF